jgi:hypothetical protein
MADTREAKALRARLEKAAKELGQDERLWLEVHSLRHRRHGRRWKAVVCRHLDVGDVLFGRSSRGVVFTLDFPSQLPEWLDAFGLKPLEPLPNDWNDVVFFGCDVDVLQEEAAQT